jgi:hypothetical protein
VEDDHVDRPGVEAQQCVKLTGTNSSIGLIVLIDYAHQPPKGAMTPRRVHKLRQKKALPSPASRKTMRTAFIRFRMERFGTPASDELVGKVCQSQQTEAMMLRIIALS